VNIDRTGGIRWWETKRAHGRENALRERKVLNFVFYQALVFNAARRVNSNSDLHATANGLLPSNIPAMPGGVKADSAVTVPSWGSHGPESFKVGAGAQRERYPRQVDFSSASCYYGSEPLWQLPAVPQSAIAGEPQVGPHSPSETMSHFTWCVSYIVAETGMKPVISSGASHKHCSIAVLR